ncbi:MAG: tetratricopeptide repeat protein [Thermoplasmata archaeon]|nr:tetratricopeptide repeat protein [Thermoplasmata archaeon]
MEEMIDRENEFRQLVRALEEMQRGRGNTIIIEGEHGVGKTYLCEKFEEYCREKGVLFVGADARRYDMGRPYSTFIQMLDDIRNLHPEFVPLGLAPFFGTRTPDIPDLRTAQSFLYEKVYAFVEAVSSEGLVLFFDNIEWLDASSVGLLHYLTMKAQQSRLLILCTYSPEDAKLNQNERVTTMISMLATEKLCVRIRLGTFGREESIAIAKNYLKDANRLVLEQIYEYARGNPGVIKELCRYLADSKDKEIGLIAPEKLKLSFENKLARLSIRELEVARIASVIGLSFDMGFLAKMCGQSEEDLVEVLEKLINLEIIEEHGDRYVFKSPVIRAFLYSQLPQDLRTQVHLRAADYLSKKCREGDEKIYALAYHYFHGENYELALRYLLRSAELSYEEYAFERTLEFLKMADRCAAHIGNMFLRAEVKSKIGDIYYGLGEFEKAGEIYNTLVEEQVVKTDAKLNASLHLKLGNLANMRADYWEALKFYEKALEIATGSMREFEMAMAHRGCGYIYLRLGNWRKALDEYSQALGTANKLRDAWLNGILFLELGNLYNMRGNLDDALMHYAMACKNFEKGKHYLDMGRALCNAGEVYVQKEEFSRADTKFSEALEYAKKTENESFVQWVETNHGFALVKLGRVEEAKKRCYAFLETCRMNKNRFGTARAFRVLGWAERELKNYQNAIEYFELAVEIHQSLGVQYELGRELWEIGRTHEEMGNGEKAARYYARALEILTAIGASYYVKKLRAKLGRG